MKREIHLDSRLFDDNLTSSTPDLIIHILIQCLMIRLKKNYNSQLCTQKFIFLSKCLNFVFKLVTTYMLTGNFLFLLVKPGIFTGYVM